MVTLLYNHIECKPIESTYILNYKIYQWFVGAHTQKMLIGANVALTVESEFYGYTSGR